MKLDRCLNDCRWTSKTDEDLKRCHLVCLQERKKLEDEAIRISKDCDKRCETKYPKED